MQYVCFSDWFEYKYCPSIPGPEVDYNTYMGISTSDIRLFIKFVLTGGKWYRVNFTNIMQFKNDIETTCYNEEDVKDFVDDYIKKGLLEEL
jgi:hypothetical protein